MTATLPDAPSPRAGVASARHAGASLRATYLLWALLALPGAHILYRLVAEDLWPEELVAPSGLWSARFIIFALMLTPLARLLPSVPALLWLLRRRRAFGVAAFSYALLHLAFYVAAMETFANMLAELGATGIWTGRAALLLILPLGLTSNDAAMRVLKAGWKRLQRLAYPMALLVLVHWIFVHDGMAEALLHAAPLVLLQLYRISVMLRSSMSLTAT